MQLDIPPSSLPSLDDSDEEALFLFNNLNPDPQSSPSPLSDEESSHRPLGRLSKLKKQSKKDKKKEKKKEKKENKMRKMQKRVKQMEAGVINIVTPLKSSKKKHHNKDQDSDGALSHNAGSSEYSSESQDKQKLQDQLLNLNPDAAEEEQDGSPRKRLKRSGRKMRIEDRQGFRVEQLGNEAQVAADKFDREYMDEDYSFDDVNKSKKKRKPKRNVPTNEQIMNDLKQHGGVVESDGEQKREGAAVAYDNGLDTLFAMKDKRKGGIRINNKFFCDLDIDPKEEEAPMPTPETLQLEIKPKTVTLSASRFTFLNKAEALKKQRGLENTVDMGEYDRRMQEKAKQSMAKAVTAMISQEYHDDIELQVRVPTIARGKSADIINNTVFLKAFSRQSVDPAEPQQPQPETKQQPTKKEGLSRQQFYKQMSEDNRMKRSKRFSEAQLKDSFKKTNLCELEEARKRNQEKKRKEALSEEEEEGSDESYRAESKMEQLLDEEERICGDIAQQEQPEQPQTKNHPQKEKAPQQQGQPSKAVDQLEEVDFSVHLKEAENEQPLKEGEPMEVEEEQQQINEENEVIEELASASHHERASELDGDQEEEEGEDDGAEQQEEQQEEDASGQLNQEQSSPLPQDIAQPNQQQLQQQMELQQQGIMLRKRKVADKPNKVHPEVVQQPIHHQQHYLIPSSQQKQNAINLPNTDQTPLEKAPLMTAEEHAEQFRNFKKLRKFAMVIAQKRRIREQGRKYASEFIEQEAEEGSDNEEHDDMIKKIDYEAEEQEYAGVDLDADLVELIDNAVDINEADEQEAFKKYLEDIRIKDREEIRKIIRGEFRSHQHEDDFDVDEDERRRQERMEEVMNWMKQRQEEDGQGIYLKPPEEEEKGDSDDDFDSEYRERKKKKTAVAAEEEEVGHIPEEEEKAMIQRFLENTLPVAKRESKQAKMFDLGQLPQSSHMQTGLGRKIGLSSLGSRSDGQPKLKKLSSLANEVLSRSSNARPAQKAFLGKQVRR